MASLCVAVLGAWVLLAPLSAALARHRDRPAAPLTRARVTRRPDPPPPCPDLASLSILRI
ncbi:hypothetical protein NKH77_05595 [Streptomyces sp. M19]